MKRSPRSWLLRKSMRRCPRCKRQARRKSRQKARWSVPRKSPGRV